MISTRFLALGLLVLGTAACAERPQHRASSDPPGSAVERAADRTLGTNASGAYPSQSDGTPGNPRGTAVGRAVGDRR